VRQRRLEIAAEDGLFLGLQERALGTLILRREAWLWPSGWTGVESLWNAITRMCDGWYSESGVSATIVKFKRKIAGVREREDSLVAAEVVRNLARRRMGRSGVIACSGGIRVVMVTDTWKIIVTCSEKPREQVPVLQELPGPETYSHVVVVSSLWPLFKLAI